MMLCLDVGNSHIYGGVFKTRDLCLKFRHTSKVSTSDELGLFLRQVLRENDCDPKQIKTISICSVVPALNYSLRAACLNYFSIEPFFLKASVKTGLSIQYNNPDDVGTDRIANAIAATELYPKQHLIVIDFGTATTFCAITANKEYKGGAILPGVRLFMEALSKNTAKLPSVEIIKMEAALGSSTRKSIQSGVFFGVLGASFELVKRLKAEVFGDEKVLVIATGGFALLFEKQNLYDIHLPDLVLQGLKIATFLNK